jgi:ADP-ribose pyrophosphatase YjhB (NUDIX family)
MSYIPWLRLHIGHTKALLTFASVALFDAAGRALLQRRADFDLWGLPGGALELDESLEACARRELAEETGLQAGALRLVGVYSEPQLDVLYPNGDQAQQYTVCFAGQVSGGQDCVDGTENRRQAFFAPGEIPFGEMLPWYTTMLQDALGGGPPAFAPPYSRPQTENQFIPLRRFVGHAALIGAGATAVTRRADGRLLMMQRMEEGVWTFPGGYSDLGENAAHTARREAYEETGLHVIPERILGVFTPRVTWTYPNGDQVQSAGTIFLCRLEGGRLRRRGPETRDAAWMTPQEVLALPTEPILAPLHRAVLAHLERGAFIL